MRPGLRKVALTVHVVASVGWLGAVAVFAALAAVGLTSGDPQVVRGVYLVMEPAARVVLLPLGIAALVTGVVQSLGTRWGLLRHYWVTFKLAITALAVLILVGYMETFRVMANAAADPAASLAAIRNPSPLAHATAALVALTAATVLAIFKPRGLTRYGRRKQRDDRAARV